ncbi:hypothetical protein COV18_01370 [Candidatus Woesearchaeota archaeon CG10_big_fil_rev_8_21_14_0_10_37_12]|nr:MAG: hypothetical protein COV18_01370 [Candidatus Woesearchaeota archaeon CG10_big_fil_rev_8_21_14_0_10_37_12]
MKKTLLILLILGIIIACGEKEIPPAQEDLVELEEITTPEQITTETPTESEQKEKSEQEEPKQKEEIPQETQTEIIIEQTKEITPVIKDLLKRTEEKLTSMQYLYGGTETSNLFLDTYQVRGNKIKIKKYESDRYVREGEFDTQYIHEGIACCEKLSRCKSHNTDNTNKKFELGEIYTPKTPTDWIKEITNDAKVLGQEVFDERSVTHIKYANNGRTTEMWLDNSYGAPHKVTVTDSNDNLITYRFNDLTFNSLKDKDFEAPCKNFEAYVPSEPPENRSASI